MSTRDEPRVRALMLGVYLPIVIFAIGEGALRPFIVLRAQDLGASASLASTIFGLLGIAALVFAVPSGALVARLGERGAAAVAVAGVVLALAGALAAPSVGTYAASVLLLGFGYSVWRLVRFSYLAGAVRGDRRGRALSGMGGAQRIGVFVGPMVAALIVTGGEIGAVFVFGVIVSVIALAVFVTVPLAGGDRRPASRPRLWDLWKEHRAVLRRAGFGASFLMALRFARPVILPLWGVHLGLEPAAIATIFGVSAGVDSGLFYLAGSIMDRFGRRWSGVPSVVLLSIAFLWLPYSDDYLTLMLVGVLMGVGNAISSGYVATLGSDMAPPEARAEFLGLWQMIVNIGVTIGPLALGGLTAIASTAAASSILGIAGLVGALYIAFMVPETLVRSRT